MDEPPYVICLRLTAALAPHWGSIDGEAASKGVDPFDLNLRRFFNYLYFWLMSHIPHDQAEDVEFKLNAPAPGSRGRLSDLERERDAESFMAFAAAVGVKPPQ